MFGHQTQPQPHQFTLSTVEQPHGNHGIHQRTVETPQYLSFIETQLHQLQPHQFAHSPHVVSHARLLNHQPQPHKETKYQNFETHH